ncbi:lipopolysaccharide biosynthesis protein [Moritella marina ATCC 15381]|uniref:Lipopolysaccharide biosynthesis protein n=1 Tax=Moritella marina ATCC 15381 TaxID=1202962 RepID=A0A5J6WM26_MORMI|nr:lipopolysaccharide biosynthesis protein [Moritella marina]QFI37492.1 lipopolysaccharide biosynthesis protein [Moritella marina ATCC 15381]
MNNIKKDLNKGIVHSLIGKYSLYIFQMMSLAILARLFTPEDFGTLAALQVLILFFQLLATSGLAPAIIHQDTISEEQRNGIFSATVIIGLLLSFLFIYLTPILATWLSLTNVSLITYVLALNVFFSAIAMLPLASLQKDTHFIIIGKAEIGAEIIAFVICILLYFGGFGVVALAMKLLVTPIGRFVFYYLYSNNTVIGQVKFGHKISSILPLFAIAKYQLGFNVLNFFSRNLDTILVAKYFGVATVGFYEKTYQIMRYPLQLFTFAINPALQPVLTRYKDKPSIIMTAYYALAYKLSAIGVVTATFIFWYADDVIIILFGSQWLSVSTLLKILALSIPVQMVLSSTGGLYQAMGATKEMFYCGIFSSTVNVSAIFIGIYSGEMTVLCISLIFAFMINYFQCFYTLHCYVFKIRKVKSFLILTAIILGGFFNGLFYSVVETAQAPNSFSVSVYNVAYVLMPILTIIIFILFSKRFLMTFFKRDI